MDVKLRSDQIVAPGAEASTAPGLAPAIEPAGPLGVAGPPHGFEMSPLNARRWRNFKANKHTIPAHNIAILTP